MPGNHQDTLRTMKHRTLADIKSPARVKVQTVVGKVALRIMEMGIIPGTELHVIRSAPFEFPIEVKIRGNLLALRESEASCILLEHDGVLTK